MYVSVDGFEAWLQETHQAEHPTILDDELPDAFSDWVSNLEGWEITEYAKTYVKEMNVAEQISETYWKTNFGK
jgi:hypothetical protein